MKKVLYLFCVLCLLFTGCSGSGSKAPKVTQKEKSEYTPQEVKKIFEKKGYKLKFEKNINDKNASKFSLYKDSKSLYIYASYTEDGLNFSSYKSNDTTYFKNHAENFEWASAENADGTSCSYDVTKGKNVTEDKCDTLSIEEAEKAYVAYHDSIYNLNLSEKEIADFLIWAFDNM